MKSGDAPHARRRISIAVAVALALGVHGQAALAADFDWNAASGDWSSAANWTPGGGPPGAADNATIANNGTAGVGTASAQVVNVNVGAGTSNNVTLFITNGFTLTATGTVTIDGSNAMLSIGNGGAPGVLDTATVDGNGRVTLNHTDANYFFTRDGTSGGGAIALTGSVVLTHSGSGTTTLTGANTHSATTVSGGGTLRAGATNTFRGINLVASGSVLDLNGFDQTVATLSGTGAVTLGTATLTVNLASGVSLFSGTISESGALVKAGSGVWTLLGTNTYTGGTTVSGGTLRAGAAGAFVANTAYTVNGGTLDLNNFNLTASSLTGSGGTVALGSAALTVNQSASTTYAGAITGAGSVTKSGTGTVNLTGTNNYAGPTTVGGGTLAVNGSLASPVTVMSGATLGGSGTISNSVSITNGGVFAPGNSIGTITVGSATFAPGSIFRVEVDAAGNADRINATGIATINGGTVDVQASGGTYQRNTTYTIINAAGGVTGTFDGVTSNLAFLTPGLSYDANNVLLTLTRNDVTLNAVAQSRNQVAVSTYLETVADTPALSGLMAQIDGLSAEQARAAFSSLSGETLSAAAFAAMQGTGRFLGLLAERPKATSRGFWTQADAARGEMKSDGNATGFDWRGGWASFGLDTEIQRGTVLGAAISYGQSDVDFESNAGSAKVKSPRIALYGGHATGPWELKGAAGYADQDFDTRRNVTIGSSTTAATATHRGNEYSAYAEAQYTLPMGGYKLKPLAALRYINLEEEGYTENGSAANLTVESRKTESIVSLLGARYVQGFNTGRGELELRALWGHEYGDVDAGVSGRLATAPATASFTVAGVPIERDFVVLGAGFANELRKNLFLHADVSAELRAHGQSQQALTAALRYAW